MCIFTRLHHEDGILSVFFFFNKNKLNLAEPEDVLILAHAFC